MYTVDDQSNAEIGTEKFEILAWAMLVLAGLGTLVMVLAGSGTGVAMAVGLAVFAATLTAVGIFEYLIARTEGALA